MPEEFEVTEQDFREHMMPHVRRWGIISQQVVDEDRVSEILDDPDIEKKFIEWVENEDDKATDEERISYLTYAMMQLFSHSNKESVLSVLSWFLQTLLQREFEDISNEELEPYTPLIKSIATLSEAELDLAEQAIYKHHDSDESISLLQNATYLSTGDLAYDSDFKVNDVDSAREGIEVYRKCMEVCDSASPQVLMIKRISEGGNPLNKDLESMPFGDILNELKKSPFEAITDGIDSDLRNGLAHGDVMVDPYTETIEIPGEKLSYSYSELEDNIRSAIISAKVSWTLPNMVLLRSIEVMRDD